MQRRRLWRHRITATGDYHLDPFPHTDRGTRSLVYTDRNTHTLAYTDRNTHTLVCTDRNTRTLAYTEDLRTL